jgi:hypothetical protein
MAAAPVATNILQRKKNMKLKIQQILTALLLLAGWPLAQAQTGSQTGITYQGQLSTTAGPVQGGLYDFMFTLYSDSNGVNAVTAPVSSTGVAVTSNGLFVVYLDFGAGVFTGATTNWLQIQVATNGGTADALGQLQPVTSTPQAIYALTAGTANFASNALRFTGSVSGDVTGTEGALMVTNVGGQSALSISNAVLATIAATNSDIPNAIVKRDVTGSFSAASLTLASNLYLPFPAYIYSGTNIFMIEHGGTFLGIRGAGVDAGIANVGVGDLTLSSPVLAGNNNTAIGENALAANTTGSDNTAAGFNALTANTTGAQNAGTGSGSLQMNTTANDNTADGFKALNMNMTGTQNTATGSQALEMNTVNDNTADGYMALNMNMTGAQNTATGSLALQMLMSANDNTAAGYMALNMNMTGAQNTAAGSQALANDTADNNTAVGYQALNANTSGSQNTATGQQALQMNTTGTANTADGALALQANTSGGNNTASGFDALNANTTGNNNTAVGFYAMLASASGSGNTALGFESLSANTGGSGDIALGYQAGLNITNGTADIDIGNPGAAADNYTIRLGIQGYHSNTYVAGIWGTTIASNTQIVIVDSTGHLGVMTNSNGPNSITIKAGLGLSGGGTVALGGSTTLTNTGVLSVTGDSIITAVTSNGAVKLTDNATYTINAGLGLSGGGTVAPGGSTTLTNTGVLSVTNGDTNIMVVTTNGAVTLLVNATPLDTYNAIVSRDANGSFNANNIALGGAVNSSSQAGVLNLPATSDAGGVLAGAITLGGNSNLFLHAYGAMNFFGGQNAGNLTMTGQQNTGLGFEALSLNAAGNNNIALGYLAGSNLTNGSSNIDIGNSGFASDNNTIRLGAQGAQSNTFVAGIWGTTLGSNTQTVVVDCNGHLGVGSNGPDSITINAGLGLSGGGTVALGGSTTLTNTGVLSVTGDSNITAVTSNGAVKLIDNATYTIIAGLGLSGGGTVAPGGSAILTNTGVLSVTNGDTNIMVITSNGAVTLFDNGTPLDTFSTIVSRDSNGSFNANNIALGSAVNGGSQAGVLNLPGTSDDGSVLAGAITLGGYSNIFLHGFGSQNFFGGLNAGNFSLSGSDNAGVGSTTLMNLTTGSYNTASGAGALEFNTTGSFNTASGAGALGATTGSNNIALGYDAGSSLTGGSANIDIGNPGFAAESSTIRIGQQGLQGNTFLAGVWGATVGAANQAVVVDSTGHLGSRPPESTTAISSSIQTGANPLAMALLGRYVYVGSQNDTLQIFDVSAPGSPTLISTTPLGANSSFVTALAVAGRYAYALTSAGTLQVIDVSDPKAPVALGSVASPTDSLTVAGRYAYAVGEGTLQIFDVANPISPVSVGSATAANPLRLTVAGRYAYVACGGSPSLQIFDVSTPSSPVLAGKYAGGAEAAAVAVSGRYAYMVGSSTFQVIDVSNPAAPQLTGTLNLGTDMTSVSVADGYAYALDIQGATLYVVDVSHPAAPALLSSVSTGDGAGDDFVVSGRYAYVLEGSGLLQVVNFAGAYFQQLEAGSTEAASLQVRDSASVGNNLDVRGGLTVSASARVAGGLSVYLPGPTGTISQNDATNYIADFSVAGVPGNISTLDVNGNWLATTFNAMSDRNAKENFQPVSPIEILDKVAALPISRWNYKTDKNGAHIGPMAQDFYSAFNTGKDEKHIATVDEEGVALGAIQGLNQKLDQKEARIQQQETKIQNQSEEINQLKSRLDRLEKMMSSK